MAACVLWRPAIALLVYAGTVSYAEGYGPRMWLRSVDYFEPVMQVLFLVLFARATWVIVQRFRSGGSFTGRLGVALLAAVAWCLVGRLIGGFGPVGTVAHLPYVVLPFVVIWIAFVRTAAASKRLIVAFVSVQVAVALVVLLIPGLDVLRGDGYYTSTEGFGIDPGPLTLSLPGASTDKNQAAVQFGHFHNPNALGFYATAALMVGAALLLARRKWQAAWALPLVVAGAVLWLNTLTRGPMLGLIALGFVFWFVVRSDDVQRRTRRIIMVVLGGAALGLGVVAAWMGVFDFLFVSSSNISVTGRLEGYEEAFRVIQANPVFGHGVEYEWPERSRVHMVSLLFAAEYGVVMGVFITWLVFWFCGFGALKIARDPSVSLSDSAFVVLGFAILAGITATNNFAAPVLCALLMAHVALQLEELRSGSGPSGRPWYRRRFGRDRRVPIRHDAPHGDHEPQGAPEHGGLDPEPEKQNR